MPPPPRRRWLDWQRGLAVLFMVEVHALDAWLAPGAGRGTLRDVLLMMGGFAAPSFLFMAGLSQALADAGLARRGVSASERRRRALGRALWLLGVAYGFRLVEYVLGGQFRVPGGWEDALRVDILNVIAIGLAVAVPLSVGRPAMVHVGLAVLGAAAAAFAAPLAAGWHHPPSRILDYLYASYPRANFSLLNWAGFLLAGSAAGRLQAERDRPALVLALGAACFAAGWAADLLPPIYAVQDFWHTSPSWFAMRLGGVLALTGALQLLPSGARGLGGLTTLGRHSLLGYFASIELTYGYLSAPLHKALSMPLLLVAVSALTALTWGLSAGADRWAAARAPAASSSHPGAPPAAAA